VETQLSCEDHPASCLQLQHLRASENIDRPALDKPNFWYAIVFEDVIFIVLDIMKLLFDFLATIFKVGLNIITFKD
jgi:hypothetical protein